MSYSYLQNVITKVNNEELIQFWMDNKQTYPSLSDITLKLFLIPDSSARAERSFSNLK